MSDFSGIETSGLSLPRIRILRSDVMKELKYANDVLVKCRKEEQAMKKHVTHTITQSISRQKSMRMSFGPSATVAEAAPYS